MLQKIQNRIDSTTVLFEFFFANEWLYDSTKLHNVFDTLSHEDKAEFACDMRKFNWRSFLEDYVHGLKIFVLKEDWVAPAHLMD